MKYILFIFMHVNSGSTGLTQEFNTREACNTALAQIANAKHTIGSFTTRAVSIEYITCVPKGVGS